MRVLALALFLSATLNAQPTWVWRTPQPTGEDLRAVAWAGTQWVAVGRAGTILTSADGANWVLQPPATREELNGVASNGSITVAVGSRGSILSSTDGRAWTPRASGTTYTLVAVAWSGSRFLAVGRTDSRAQAAVATSTDGVAWTKQDPKESSGVLLGEWHDLTTVAWMGDRFIALGPKSDGIETTVDGMLWKRVSKNTQSFQTLAWTGNQLVAIGDNSIYTSKDGAAWTERLSVTFGRFASLAGNGERVLAVGEKGAIYSSPDGNQWSPVDTGGHAYHLFAVAASPTQFVTVGEKGANRVTPDGLTWVKHGTTLPSGLRDVTAQGPMVVAVGVAGAILTSDDGVAWTARVSHTSSALNSVLWNGQQYLAFGDSAVAVSSNGTTWTARPSGVQPVCLLKVIWTGSLYVAAASGDTTRTSFEGGSLWTSPDGIVWTPRYYDSQFYASALAWNGNVFVASVGYPLTSSDGKTWKENAKDFGQWENVAWAGSQFVRIKNSLTADTGIVERSLDGVTWIGKDTIGFRLYSVAWTGTEIVAAGLRGAVSSQDGTAWKTESLPTWEPLHSMAWASGRLVAVGGPTDFRTTAFILTREKEPPTAAGFFRGGSPARRASLLRRHGTLLFPTEGPSQFRNASGRASP